MHDASVSIGTTMAPRGIKKNRGIRNQASYQFVHHLLPLIILRIKKEAGWQTHIYKPLMYHYKEQIYLNSTKREHPTFRQLQCTMIHACIGWNMPISNPKINLPLIKVVRFEDINLSGILTSLLFSSFGKKTLSALTFLSM